MRTRRNTTKVARLLRVLRDSPPMPAGMLAATAEMNHESVLGWLYVLHDAGLVECWNENPRKWRWKQ